MEAVPWVIAGIGLLAVMFALGHSTRRWWVVAIPFALPAGLGLLGAGGAVFENRDDCYEACAYVWWLFYAVASLAVAAVLALAAAAGVLVGRRRRATSAAGTGSASSRPTSRGSSAAAG